MTVNQSRHLTSIPRLSPPGSGDDGLLADVLGLPCLDGVAPSEMLAVGCGRLRLGHASPGVTHMTVWLADGRVLAERLPKADAEVLAQYLRGDR